MNKVPIDRLRAMLRLDSDTGQLYWLSSRRNGAGPGDIAGWVDGGRYIRTEVDGVRLSAHRVVWALHHGDWPPDDMQIDHVNGVKTDNRPVNLRLATNSQNQMNVSSSKRPASGMKGVYFDKKTGRWRSMIMINKKTLSLGYFESKEAAHKAYCGAAMKVHGSHANTGTRSDT